MDESTALTFRDYFKSCGYDDHSAVECVETVSTILRKRLQDWGADLDKPLTISIMDVVVFEQEMTATLRCCLQCQMPIYVIWQYDVEKAGMWVDKLSTGRN